MDAFKENIKTYLESVAQSAKKADETIGKVDRQLEKFYR